MTLFAVDHLSVALPAGSDRVLAVDDVSFSLQRGETLCLIGGSGSGKSVLAAAMMAALPTGLVQTAGAVTLAGIALTGLPESKLRRLRGNRIALVPQNPVAALNPVFTVGDQIAEVLIIHGNFSADDRQRRVDDLLASVGLGTIAGIADRYPHQLSGGQCQRAAIAMALAMAPDVLIADEPTTALDTISQAQILHLLADLKSTANIGLVFISHDLAIVADIADRIAVLDSGRIVEIGAAEALLSQPRHPVTAALLDATRPPPPRQLREAGPPVLAIDAVSKAYADNQVVDSVTLALAAGTTLAVVGGSGSGKTTLARLVMQLATPDSGRITIDGIDIGRLGATERRKARPLAQMVFQDAGGALNPRRSVGAAIARAAALAGVDRAACSGRALELLGLVGLPGAAYDRLPAAFSGGQRQRIGIARALAMAPKLLICDESVSGLDAVVAAEVLALLDGIQARTGIAILFITHDLRMATAIADRIAVMDRGRLVEIAGSNQLLTNPVSTAAKALVGAMPGLRSLGPTAPDANS